MAAHLQHGTVSCFQQLSRAIPAPQTKVRSSTTVVHDFNAVRTISLEIRQAVLCRSFSIDQGFDSETFFSLPAKAPSEFIPTIVHLSKISELVFRAFMP